MSISEQNKLKVLLPPLNCNEISTRITNTSTCDGVLVSATSRAKNREINFMASSNDKNDDCFSTVVVKSKIPHKSPEEFYVDLQKFHDRKGTPITQVPKISGRIIDLHHLYTEVTNRGGFRKVNLRDEWKDILPELNVQDKCVNAAVGVKQIYRRYLENYEKLNFFSEDADKMEAIEAMEQPESGRSRARYQSNAYMSNSAANTVPMSYNYRQHMVNMDRRRMYGLSTDFHNPSPFEKMMLALVSPLPNEQDFAINACIAMANENKQTLQLNEYPKLLDLLLAHVGVFSDNSLCKLFQHIYTSIRSHSLFYFWRVLLYDKPQILELFNAEQTFHVTDLTDTPDYVDPIKQLIKEEELFTTDLFNLTSTDSMLDYVGKRVQQIVSILRNLSFSDENGSMFAKSRTCLRFIVMSANIRCGNIHIQALDIAGNIATELELLDPTTDELSRCFMATLTDGIESVDRGVIINCLEVLYKLFQKEGNEDYIYKCLNLKFYQSICSLLSLSDIMLLMFTLEAIYALTSMGTRFCHMIMQVRGVIDQLVSLVTVEAQSYGPDGCILMRVVETVPGNMLPMVAQNIANLQNIASIQKQQQSQSILTTHMQQQQQEAVLDQTVLPDTDQTQLNQPQQQQYQHQILSQQFTQNFTQEDEQYALAWLGATFERAATVDSHVEQHELYRMYLSHCQKSGKHSVVNNLQFPRLVRLIFNNNVGPVTVKLSDGSELPGFHYVAIRLRAQPLPIQSKTCQVVDTKLTKSHEVCVSAARKPKKKQKQIQLEPNSMDDTMDDSVKQDNITTSLTITSAANTITTDETKIDMYSATPAKPVISTADIDKKAVVNAAQQQLQTSMVVHKNSTSNVETATNPQMQSYCTPLQQQPQPTQQSVQHQQQPSSSLIKSLLANKVNQRQQKQKELTVTASFQTTTPTNAPASVAGNISQSHPQQPIKVTSTAITAFVNNPLMQNTSVKVGQTTIKPLNPQVSLEKKQTQIIESVPPPLAPLSGANVAKDASGRPMILANQMLVEILDKKNADPPIPTTIAKRKLEDIQSVGMDIVKRIALDDSKNNETDETTLTPSKNAANLYAEMAASILEDEDLDDIPPLQLPSDTSTSTVNASNEQFPHQSLVIASTPKLQPTLPQQPLTTPTTSLTPQNLQRQLIFQTPHSPQLKIVPQNDNTSQHAIPTAMATIKTDQGLQTVPVILQQKSNDRSTQSQFIQQVIQQNSINSPQPATQYVLATNPQGQTYLVAQQTQSAPPPPPPPTQTVLVTQTPQQQSVGTKTIIILQQQPLPTTQSQQLIAATPNTTQKMIMTTSQGQQLLITQRTTQAAAIGAGQSQQQIFINSQTGTTTHIQHVPVSSSLAVSQCGITGGTNILQRQIIQSQTPTQTQATQSQYHQHTGQISPSLLSQLNHIPATIKLHQPQPTAIGAHPHQQMGTIPRLGKSVSIIQSAAPTHNPTPPPPPIQIPQLQQHQSIIQQHIISGPPEKRQVILGGRPIEIKETLITQAQPPPQQSQLNSQTIITKQSQQQQQQQQQQQPQQLTRTTAQALLQQQQIRTVIEHQQRHPSIIQQKVVASLQSKIAEHHTIQQQQQQQHQQNISQTKPPQAILPKATAQPAMQPNLTTIKRQIITGAQITTGTHIRAQSEAIVQTPISWNKTSTSTTTPIETDNAEPPPLVVSHSLASSALAVSSSAIVSSAIGKTDAVIINQQNTVSEKSNDSSTSNISNANITVTQPADAGGINVPVSTSTVSVCSTMPPIQSSTVSTSVLAPILPNQNQPLSLQQSRLTTTSGYVADMNWLYICDWRNCPRRKYKSLNDLHHHACTVHCPDHLEAGAEIFCQWGHGPGLCDGIPRKRYSLMTHIIDRHLTVDSLRSAMQRRIATGTVNMQPTQPPVTIVRNMEHQSQGSSTVSPVLCSSSPTSLLSSTGSSAIHAIKRHNTDFINPKELMDENEGPVTKSIRLTAALIIRNLVTYTSTAKRLLRCYESHLANVALSNVESSGAISHILYELNN